MSALISDCGKYRHWLKRDAQINFPTKGPAVFCMLNPSTADHEKDDPTIRRLRGFANRWDNSGIIVVNLYDFRATQQADLDNEIAAASEDNDSFILAAALESREIICAWGVVPMHRKRRVSHVLGMLQYHGVKLWCLGLTKSGDPRHPLYVQGDTPLIEYSPVII